MQSVSVADARQHLSEILGKVAYGRAAFIITKKGRPMACLVPVNSPPTSKKKPATLGTLRGWLADDDPFFNALETIRKESRRHPMSSPFGRKK